jgi:hypothetical protein
MKKSILFFIVLTSILAGCSAPQVTVTSEVTVTLTPLSTETPIPTPTLHPQFIEVQEKIAASGHRFTLNQDGTVKDGSEIIPGLTVTPNGTMMLIVGGEEIELDSSNISFDDEKGVNIVGYERNEEGQWVRFEIKEYPICSSVEYRNCVIENVDELFDGSYMRWFATLSQPFAEGQLDKRPWYKDGFGLLYPDAWIEREPGTVTAHLNVTYALFEMDGVEYKLVPFELPDPGNPANPDENIKVLGFQLTNEIKDGVIGKKYPRSAFDRFSNYWATEVKVPPISTDFRYPLTNVEIPLARMTWEKLGAEKMAEIFQRVQNGDVAALKELRGYPVMLTNQFSDNYTK